MNESIQDPETPKPRIAFSPKLVLGIGIIVAGLVLALDNLGLVEGHFILKLWPLILIVMGFAKVRQEGTSQGISGYVLIAAGVFLLLVVFGHGDLGRALSPLLVVMLGVLIVVRVLKQQRGTPAEVIASENFLQGSAIFGGVKRRIQSQNFKGGELTAMFGGVEADLRQAAIGSAQATLDIFVLFGGAEIRVPEGWEVVIQTTSIFGSTEDKTYAPATNETARPRLVLTGLVLFGGVEVQH